METIEQKKRRVFGKQFLDTYKKELSNLINPEISDYEFLSLVETDKLYLKEINDGITIKKIDFDNKIDILDKLLKSFSENKCENYFILTSYYKDCGAVVIKSLNNFNIGFDFNAEHSGLIEIFDSILENKILMDYYEENDKKIDIEVNGFYWTEKAKLIL